MFHLHIGYSCQCLRTWYEARELCGREGGTLPSVNEDQFDFMRKLTEGDEVWIGGYLSGKNQWRWTDGKEFTHEMQDSIYRKGGMVCT